MARIHSDANERKRDQVSETILNLRTMINSIITLMAILITEIITNIR